MSAIQKTVEPGALRELLIFCVVFFISRLVALAAIAWISGGNEFSGDAGLHLRMLGKPLFLLLGDTQNYGQYPPLLPLAEAMLGYPLQLLFSDFIAVRLVFILFELGAAVFFGMIVLKTVADPRFRLWIYAACILMPVGYMTSVFLAQDEVISEFLLAVVVWLVLCDRRAFAAFVCGLGVVTGKIFFLVPLAALIGTTPFRQVLRPLLASLVPIVVVYGITSYNAISNGNPLPLTGFAPDTPPFSVTVWTAVSMFIYEIPPDLVRRASAVSALVLGMLPLVLIWLRGGGSLGAVRCVYLLTAMLLWTFFAFYHVNAPYYLLPVPLLLPFVRSIKELLLIALALNIPYAAKVFGGIVRGVERGRESSAPFISLYQSIFGDIDPNTILGMTLLASVISVLCLAIFATRRTLAD